MSTGQPDRPDQPAPDPEETTMDTENLPNAYPLADQEQGNGGDALTPADFDANAGELLLNEVREALTRFVILPDEHSTTGVVLWIAATHAVPAWAHAARLVIRAPEKRCGKSRLLDLVEATCHDPLLTVNASPSAVYRSIGMKRKNPPTILLDEADTIFGPKAGENEDLRGLLNAGHQRNRPALRYNASTSSVEKIQTFAMAALAGIGAMPDTIEDRAVVIRMRRRAPGEAVAPLRTRRDGPALDNLRNRLNQWVRAHLEHLGTATPDMPVEDRAADTWEPLLAIADLAGGPWPDLAREACITLTETRDANAQTTLQTRLLTDCRAAFGDAEALPTTVLLERLHADPEAPWATYQNNGLTAMKLGFLLRDFDIRSDTIRFAGSQAKGYRRTTFADAWARYCATPTTCAVCHQPLTHDDGTHTHPTCDPEARR
ncbi:DUF3631 domain-containing protein [Nocardioides albus]|uniref:DUF3631 domain-containing protein n=1 Tax=Nocardioides albus TaxID=1841 RepID=A0A7W5A8R1_9ACTN|nr:DUF3631 domain-containing protein [Nocardioides albus]MBB3091575.1 hypothetical protein [Nocardioides albus]GGU40846.1 hypothetical protein GCM10007979_45000 [Nocardioides albus]